MKIESNRVWLVVVTLVLTASSLAAYEGVHGSSHGRPKVNYDSLYALAVPLDQSADGQKIIERCLDAYGGREHLAALETIGLDYHMISSLSQDTSDFDRMVAPDRRFKTSRQGSGIQKMRYLDGRHAWKAVGTDLESLNGPGYCATLFSYLTLLMPLAIETEPFTEIRVGRREADPLDYFYLKKRDSLMIVIGIDSTGSMIRSSEGIIYVDEAYQVYINLFDDHRKVDGYLFPHRLTIISQGLEIGRLELETAEINPNPTSDQFRPVQSFEDSF